MANNKKTENSKKAESSKKEFASFNLPGIVTTAMYGRRTFSNGKKDKEDKYRISLKCTKESIEKLKEAAEPYYENVSEEWIPNWMTEETKEDGGYINLSSGFDIHVGGVEDHIIVGYGTMTDYIADHGGNINGSKVVVSVTIKEGAIYPAAMLIKELHVQDIGSMFDDDFVETFEGDDLPF